MTFFKFIEWVVGFWNNILVELDKLKIGGASFSIILLSWAFLNLVIFRILSSRG